jgi:hypothetical protein
LRYAYEQGEEKAETPEAATQEQSEVAL